MINKKGQGTIEYLVIIAIVIVIALVVVGLLLQVMDQGSAIPEQTAKIAWQSATPWAIVDWSQSETELTVILKNNTYETMIFKGMSVTGAAPTADTNNVSAGATIEVKLPETQTGNSGKNYSYTKEKIEIAYERGTITGRVQHGTADILGIVN